MQTHLTGSVVISSTIKRIIVYKAWSVVSIMTIYRWASSRVLSKDFQEILRLTNQGEFTGNLRSSYITFMLSAELAGT